jgi:hypothetical protein
MQIVSSWHLDAARRRWIEQLRRIVAQGTAEGAQFIGRRTALFDQTLDLR